MSFYHQFSRLSAAGATDALGVGDYAEHILQYTVASINTSVTLRAEGSNDGTNFFNLSTNNSDTTVTANGTNAFIYTGKINHIRLKFVSESGGTAVTVDSNYSGR